MRQTFRQIAAFMDPVERSRSLAGLIGMHQQHSRPTTFRQIWRRHNHPESREQDFLFLNTWLMDARVDDLIGDSTEVTKPAVRARAHEIGRFIRDRIQMAALAEVWLDRERDRILSEWPDGSRPRSPGSGGPPHRVHDTGRIMSRSSGLLTISQVSPIVDRKSRKFGAEEGGDAWAAKGVLLAVIDVGMGPSRLEVYSTHLNASRRHRPVRFRQLLDLAQFIRDTHNPANPAIIAGDFNIHRHSSELKEPRRILKDYSGPRDRIDPFRELLLSQPGPLTEFDVPTILMNAIGFKDLWEWRNGTLGYTSYMEVPGVPERICRGSTAADGMRYCDDFRDPPDLAALGEDASKSDRLDYVFTNQASEAHSFTLDFTRPRRLTVVRPPSAPDRDRAPFISDHLGIATRLLLVPR